MICLLLGKSVLIADACGLRQSLISCYTGSCGSALLWLYVLGRIGSLHEARKGQGQVLQAIVCAHVYIQLRLLACISEVLRNLCTLTEHMNDMFVLLARLIKV